MSEARKRVKTGPHGEPVAVSSVAPAAEPVRQDDETNKGHATPPVPVVAAASKAHYDFLEEHKGWVPLAIFAFAAFTRFYRLDEPHGVVFDEHHFGRFTNQYTAGTYFFDIHPPLGKLTLWATGQLVNYDDKVCNYTKIDQNYAPDCLYYWLRFTSASFGSLTAPLLYAITRNFGGSVRAGILASLLFVFDGLNIGESRLVLIDAQVVFWCAACLAVVQCWWARWNAHVAALEDHEAREAEAADAAASVALAAEVSEGDAAVQQTTASSEASVPAASQQERLQAQLHADVRFLDWRARLAWVVAVGVVCGNSVSVKFTGLATPAFAGFESLFAVLVLRRAYPFLDLLGVLATGVLTFAFYYWVHFALLPLTGDGDNYMPAEFKAILKGAPDYRPEAEHPGFWKSFVTLNKDMLVTNSNILEPHTWDSVWWEWIFNLRGVLYYSVDQGHTYTRGVYLLGNPMTIWLVFGLLALAAVLVVLWVRLRWEPSLGLARYKTFFHALVYCLAVYALNLLPYILVKRSCFIYHYMPALMYAEVLAGLLVGQLAGRRWMPRVMALLLTPVVGIFLYYAPWVYAFPLTSEAHAQRRWLPRWN